MLGGVVATTSAVAQERDGDRTAAPPGSELTDPDASFERALRSYREGRFDASISILRRLIESEPEPVLWYNLARSYEGKGELVEAAEAYERYLLEDPEARDRGAIERRIESLRQQIEEREAMAERERRLRDAAARPAAGAPESNVAWTVLPWVVTGVGLAGIATGIGFGVLAKNREGDAQAEPRQIEAGDLANEAETFATVSNVGFVAGAVLAVGGASWLIVASAIDDDDISLSLSPTSVTLRGRF